MMSASSTSALPTPPSVTTEQPLALKVLARHSETVNHLIETLAERFSDAPPRLVESMLYSLRAGGKRLRPALILETFHACSGSQSRQHAAGSAALAMEMIHTFSLVHDDLPAMDNDDLRRGMPTNHKVFGEAMAILAGDALLSGAVEVLADVEPAELSRSLTRELTQATGPKGMVGGQVLDIDGENRRVSAEELSRIHRLKTGALLTASCRLGAMAAGADETTLGQVTSFGRHIGLAFQIVDDILDVTSTPEELGKATQKDSGAGKNTYPAIHGLAASQVKADEELKLALAALSSLGASADGLRALARFVVERRT